MPILVWFSSPSHRRSKLRSKHFTTLSNNKPKSVLYILLYFPHCLLSVGFCLAPGRAEINNTNLILETSLEKQHPWLGSLHAMAPPRQQAAAPGTRCWPIQRGCEHPDTHSLLPITVSLASNLEDRKVYNNLYIITFSCWYLKGRLKSFSGLRIIFLYCYKA